MAESQISKAERGTSTVVSVKSSVAKKRKHEETPNESISEEKRVKGKKTRRSMKTKK